MTPKHARRLKMYRQGLSDREIADAEGVKETAIASWRWDHGLRKSKDPDTYIGGCSMRKVLAPEECEVVLKFFARLLALDDQRRRVAG